MYRLGESISIFNCIDVQQELLQYVSECQGICEIDGSDLADLDAAGIQLLLSLQKYCYNDGIKLSFVHVQEQMKNTFIKLGLETLLGKETT